MALYPASRLTRVLRLSFVAWIGASVWVNGQSDPALLLSTEVVTKTGDPTGVDEINLNFFDGVEFFGSDTVVFFANTDAPVQNFTITPKGSGFFYQTFDDLGGPFPIVGTDEVAPEVELNGIGFLFDNVPNGAWDLNESGVLAYNATIKGDVGNPSSDRPILYSQPSIEGEPERLINLTGLGHGDDDGSITITSIATGEEIGGYFSPTAATTQLGLTSLDRLTMVNDFGGGVPGGGSGQISDVKRGVYVRSTLGVWSALFRVGDQAPGFEEGVTVAGVSFATSEHSQDTIALTPLSNGATAFWRFDGLDDVLTLIASDDEPAPGFSGRDWSPGDPLLGFGNSVVFFGAATANGETDIDAIWLEVENGGETTLEAIFEASEDGSISYQTTEGSVTFLSLSEPLVGPDGLFYFFATGRDEVDTFVSGIWKLQLDSNNAPESIDLLATTNAEAPGQLFNELPMLFQDFQLRKVNERGDLLFSATLFRNANTRGSLWLSTELQPLLAVAAEGDTLGSGENAEILDEFYFNEYAGERAERSVALGSDGAVAFLGLIPDGFDAGSSRDFALFRSELSLPKYIWSGKANTNLWWDISGSTTNWDNDVGENWSEPPGADGFEVVEIGALWTVNLDTAPASIGNLSNLGALGVNRALTIQFGAEIERMTLDADLIAHTNVDLLGADNRWLSGALDGDGGATVALGGTFTIAPRNSDAIALQTVLNVSGKVVHENELVALESGESVKVGSIQIGLTGEYELGSGTINDLTGGGGRVSNDGTLRKVGSGTGTVNAPYESTLGEISVEGGTLRFTDGVQFKSLGNQASVSGNALLEFGNAGTGDEEIQIDASASASGAGTLRLAHGVALKVGDGASPVFGLTGFDGVGLEIADATVSGEGGMLIGNDAFPNARATFLDATFDSLGGGLVNNGFLEIGTEANINTTTLTLSETQLVNNAVVSQHGDVDIVPIEAGAVAIDNHGTYTFPDTGDILGPNTIDDYLFNNASDGTVEKKGPGISRVEANFINRGTLKVASGTLALRFGSSFHANSKLIFGGGDRFITGKLDWGELGVDLPTEIEGSVQTEATSFTSERHELRINSGVTFSEGATLTIGGIETKWSGGAIQGPESSSLNIPSGGVFSILPGSSGPRVLNVPVENHGRIDQSATLSGGGTSFEDADTLSNHRFYVISDDADIENLELTLEKSSELVVANGSTSSLSNLRVIGGDARARTTITVSPNATLILGGAGDKDRVLIESGPGIQFIGSGALQVKDTGVILSNVQRLDIATEDVLIENVELDAAPTGFIRFSKVAGIGETEPPFTIKETQFNEVNLVTQRPLNLEGDIYIEGGKIRLEEDGELKLSSANLTNMGGADIVAANAVARIEMLGVSSIGTEEDKFTFEGIEKVGFVVKQFSTATVNALYTDSESGTVSIISEDEELRAGIWIVEPDGVLELDGGAPISTLGRAALVVLKGSGTFNNLPNVTGPFTNNGYLQLSDNAQLEVSGTFTNNNIVSLKSGGSISAPGYRGKPASVLSGKSGEINGNVELEGKAEPGESAVDDSDLVTRLASIIDRDDEPITLHGGVSSASLRATQSLGTLATLAEVNEDAIGVITINGNLTQAATSVIELDLAGPNPEEQDRLIVNGTATLAGTLRISAADTIPADGTAFAPITATSIEGSFDSVVFDVPTGRLLFDVEIGDTGVTASANVLDVSTYAEWRAAVFTTEEQADDSISGILADPDEDGLINLLEYALDGNPRVGTPALVGIEIDRNAEGAPEHVTVDFPWANGMTDVAYRIEYSTDLVNWATLDATLVGSEDLGLATLTTLSGSVAAQSGDPLFARLVVSEL